MTVINEFKTGLHTEQAHAYCDLLWHLASADKRVGFPSLASDRCASVDILCEAHYAQLGRMPDSNVLERLASLILFDELTDTHPDKMSREEYPILSDSQREERLGDEVSEKWAQDMASDGRDYKLPTRENLRKLRT